MRSHAIIWVLFLCQGFPLSTEFGLFETEDLYKNGVDLGITSLEKTEVNETLRKTMKPWLIQFYSSWCGHCQRFAPTFKEASEKIEGVTFAKVNTEEEQALGAHFGIRSIPTLMIFREQIGIFSQPGSMTAKDLEDLLDKAKSIDMDEVRKELASQK